MAVGDTQKRRIAPRRRMPYHIRVRDYLWSNKNVLVQSPCLDLKSVPSQIIIRPLEGTHKDEPRIVDTTSLKDAVFCEEYHDEAHGVIRSTTPNASHFPVWVPLLSKIGEHKSQDEINVVNLRTMEQSIVPVARVYWVPSLQTPDDHLCTIFGAPRHMGKTTETSIHALLHRIGIPNEAKFTLLPSSRLSEFLEMDELQKRKLFEIQWIMSEGMTLVSPVSQNLCQFRLLPDADAVVEWQGSPLRTTCDAQLWIVQDDFMMSTDESSEEETVYDEHSNAQQKVAWRRYPCRCTHADLGPTLNDPFPPHKHIEDDECRLGSEHSEHCVFANHRPRHCVISGLKEPHEHCPPITPSRPPVSEVSTVSKSEGVVAERVAAAGDQAFSETDLGPLPFGQWSSPESQGDTWDAAVCDNADAMDVDLPIASPYLHDHDRSILCDDDTDTTELDALPEIVLKVDDFLGSEWKPRLDRIQKSPELKDMVF